MSQAQKNNEIGNRFNSLLIVRLAVFRTTGVGLRTLKKYFIDQLAYILGQVQSVVFCIKFILKS